MNYKDLAEAQFRSGTFDKQQLPDIAGLSLPDGDPEARMRAFLQAAGNPYLFRVGDIGVHVVFSGSHGDTLQGRVRRVLSKSI